MGTNQTSGLSFKSRAFYGAGGIANGVYSNGLSFFLLLYFNQVIGLSAELTGLALAIALLVDAISDPLVGFLSDNTNAKSGRRHPYLYLAILPIAILYWLIWNPPASLAGQEQLFFFLVAVTVGLRLAMTLYDVPHNAMIPEMTSSYTERTRLAGIKVSATWISGQFMVIAMYLIWLVPTEEMPYGILNKAGYQEAGLVSAILIAIAIFITATGLRSFIPAFSKSTHTKSVSAGNFGRQLGGALKVPSLRAILLSATANAVAVGISSALWTYLMSYYWELTSDQIALILVSNLIGAIIASLTFRNKFTSREKNVWRLSSFSLRV